LQVFDTRANSKKKYTDKMDIWALGMILIHTYLGRDPLKDQENSFFNDSDFGFRLKNVEKFLIDLQNNPRQIFGEQASKRFINFIQMCLNENPKKRWSAYKLQHHKWLESVKNAEKVSAVERLTGKEMKKYLEDQVISKGAKSGAFTAG
jgi:serine/threonine protein kinase